MAAGEGVRGPLYTCVYCHYTQGNRYESKTCKRSLDLTKLDYNIRDNRSTKLTAFVL